MSKKDISSIQANSIIEEDFHGLLFLPEWSNFNRHIPSGKQIDRATGVFDAHIVGSLVDHVNILSQDQFNAIQFLTKNTKTIQDNILDQLLLLYPTYKAALKDYMPLIKTKTDFLEHLELFCIHILDDDKKGFAYTSLEIECTWDEEHGLGILLHKDKVISVGSVEEAFNVPTRKWWEFWK